MSKAMLVIANGVLALALGGVSYLGAQTGPANRYDCCRTSTEKAKFCCDECCTSEDGKCSSSEDCKVKPE